MAGLCLTVHQDGTTVRMLPPPPCLHPALPSMTVFQCPKAAAPPNIHPRYSGIGKKEVLYVPDSSPNINMYHGHTSTD